MTCKDCIHYEACVSTWEAMGYEVEGTREGAEELCKQFADKSLYIKLPCKVDDTVYGLAYRWGTQRFVVEGKVWGISVEHTNKVQQFYLKYRYNDYGKMENATGMLNKTVFLTREEAEAALKESEK